MTVFPVEKTRLLAFRIHIVSLSLGFAALDQLSKSMATQTLVLHQPVPVIQDFFQLHLTHNTGAAFSLMEKDPHLLLLLSASLFIILVLYAFVQPSSSPWQRTAIALILGGAMSNLLDRLWHGAVIDFLDFIVIHYPIFNLADCFIFTGAIAFCFSHIRLLFRSQ